MLRDIRTRELVAMIHKYGSIKGQRVIGEHGTVPTYFGDMLPPLSRNTDEKNGRYDKEIAALFEDKVDNDS